MRLIKYWAALFLRNQMEKQVQEMLEGNQDTKEFEKFNQKWIHVQGQIQTRGRMRWDWDKVLGR